MTPKNAQLYKIYNSEEGQNILYNCEEVAEFIQSADANAIEWVKEQIKRIKLSTWDDIDLIDEILKILDAHGPQTKPYTDGSSFVGSHRLQGKDKTGDSSNSKGVESFDDGLTRVADSPSDNEFRKFCERLSKDKWVYIQANPDMEIIFKEARRGYVKVEDVERYIKEFHTNVDDDEYICYFVKSELIKGIKALAEVGK